MSAALVVALAISIAAFVLSAVTATWMHTHRKTIEERFAQIATVLERLATANNKRESILKNLENLDQKADAGFEYIGGVLANLATIVNDVDVRIQGLERATGVARPKVPRIETPAPIPPPHPHPPKR